MARRDREREIPAAFEREETAPERWLRTLRLSGFTVMMLGLLILAVVVLAPNLKIFFEQRAELARLQESVDGAQESVDELEAQIDRWSDPAFIEAEARDRLLYVYPGEQSYLVIDDQPSADTAAAPQPITDDLVETEVDWVSSLLSSVYTAGLTDAPADELTDPAEGTAP